MKNIMFYLSFDGVLLTISPSIAFVAGQLELAQVKFAMLWGMVLWYGCSLASSLLSSSDS
jgi:hypothetical protein